MDIEEQIKVVSELLDGVKELNGEFSGGWEKDIEKGERLLTHLKKVEFSLFDVSGSKDIPPPPVPPKGRTIRYPGLLEF
jgi:hypothetical protein